MVFSECGMRATGLIVTVINDGQRSTYFSENEKAADAVALEALLNMWRFDLTRRFDFRPMSAVELAEWLDFVWAEDDALDWYSLWQVQLFVEEEIDPLRLKEFRVEAEGVIVQRYF